MGKPTVFHGRSDISYRRSEVFHGRSDISQRRSDVSPGHPEVSPERLDVPPVHSEVTLMRSEVFLRRSEVFTGRSEFLLVMPSENVFYTFTSINDGQFAPEKTFRLTYQPFVHIFHLFLS